MPLCMIDWGIVFEWTQIVLIWKVSLMNLLDICCYNVKDIFGMIFDDLIIKCCYGCGRILAHYYLCIDVNNWIMMLMSYIWDNVWVVLVCVY